MDQIVLSLVLIAIVENFKQENLKCVKILTALILFLCVSWAVSV